jgi:adenosylcobinamide kinase/adenosylcobinamide-phosphate guanylyltransferase
MLTLLLGGARSGKSTLAVEIAARLERPVTFIATAEALDDELSERIDRHRAERPDHWATVETPIDLELALTKVPPEEVVIVDCLTMWVANQFGAAADDDTVIAGAQHVAASARDRAGRVVVISNEVGSGIVPADALSRRYRDALGRVNAIFAAHADEAYLVVAGRVLALGTLETSNDATGSPG